MKRFSRILLITGILILVNLLSYRYFVRWDMTSDKRYTLSNATKNILKNLDDPVTVKAYFSANMPPDIAKAKEDFKDLLIEYASISNGNVEYKFIDPSESQELEKEALQAGLKPVLISVRDKDEIKQQKAFMGAVISYEDNREVIPFLKPGAAMEYELTTAIKKVSLTDKENVAILSGNGEPGLDQLGQLYQALSILYKVEDVNLKTADKIDLKYKTAIIIAPKDSFDITELEKLDSYLSMGGNLIVAINRVEGDFNTSSGRIINTALESWLEKKGIVVEPKFVVDADCGTVNVQQRQGFFTMVTPVKFPYLPVIRNFTKHPVTDGIEEVLLMFASPLRFKGDSTVTFTVLARTSKRSGTVPGNTYFDVLNKKWTAPDFNEPHIPVAGIFEGKLTKDANSKIIVYTDGDFPVTGTRGQGQSKNNISFLANAVDWLADDTGLIELRTKGVASRPIKQEFLGEEAASKRNLIKYLNFGLPVLLVILTGIFIHQRRKAIRIKRMQEQY